MRSPTSESLVARGTSPFFTVTVGVVILSIGVSNGRKQPLGFSPRSEYP